MAYKDPKKAKAWRQGHQEQIKASAKVYRQDHREITRAYRRNYRQAHKEQEAARSRAYNQRHREEERARKRAYGRAIFDQALRILGSKCRCPGCDESEPLFLTIDHIHGRPKGLRKDALLEAKRSGWDTTKFQILCANCNFAKRDKGFCPVHQKSQDNNNMGNSMVLK